MRETDTVSTSDKKKLGREPTLEEKTKIMCETEDLVISRRNPDRKARQKTPDHVLRLSKFETDSKRGGSRI